MTNIVTSKTLTKNQIMDTVYHNLVGRLKNGERKNQFAAEDIVSIMSNAETIYGNDRLAKALYVGYMTNAGEYAVLPAEGTYITNVVTTNGDVITAGIVIDESERVTEVGTGKTYGAAAIVSYSVFKR